MKKRLIILATGLIGLAALGAGGTAIAGAAGAFDDESPAVPASQAALARAAALEIVGGGGKVNSVERDSEDGATYEVEVTRPDGVTVDVRLDASYRRVAVEGDTERGDQSSD